MDRYRDFGFPEANREDPDEKVYQIQGIDITFSSNPTDFDNKAVDKLHEIRQMDPEVRDRMEVCDGRDPRCMKPHDMPGDLFLFRSASPFSDFWYGRGKPDAGGDLFLFRGASPFFDFDSFWYGRGKPDAGDGWQLHSTYGVWRMNGVGYKGLKRFYVYHEGGRKTNRIMNVYSIIQEGLTITTNGTQLCHVFQSDNYDPRPIRKPDYYAFPTKAVDTRVACLEALMMGTDAFKDKDEFDPSTVIAKGGKRKKSTVWEDFTEIKVLGPDGIKVATLAICGPCGMVYLTGTLREDEKEKGKYKFKNNGTKTLKEHKCSGQQHHIAGNPQ